MKFLDIQKKKIISIYQNEKKCDSFKQTPKYNKKIIDTFQRLLS